MMSSNLDTTFRQCVHGIPKCEKCKNIRVIEWVNATDKFPQPENPILFFIPGERIFTGYYCACAYTDMNYYYSDKGIAFNPNRITHWADASKLNPSLE